MARSIALLSHASTTSPGMPRPPATSVTSCAMSTSSAGLAPRRRHRKPYLRARPADAPERPRPSQSRRSHAPRSSCPELLACSAVRPGFGDKLDFLSRSRLCREAGICGAKYADDGIPTSHGVIGRKNAVSPPPGGTCSAPSTTPALGSFRVDRSRQNRPIEPYPDPVWHVPSWSRWRFATLDDGVVAKPGVVARPDE